MGSSLSPSGVSSALYPQLSAALCRLQSLMPLLLEASGKLSASLIQVPLLPTFLLLEDGCDGQSYSFFEPRGKGEENFKET